MKTHILEYIEYPVIELNRDERRLLMRILDAAEQIEDCDDDRRLFAEELNRLLRVLKL